MTATTSFLPPLERVLLLDDDSFMMELMADMLQQLGVRQVQKMTDARLALQKMQSFTPDLLVCDLCMPDTDGIEFLEKVALGGFQGKVMLYSGADSGVLRAAQCLALARGLNMLGAFKKPIQSNDLHIALAAAFQLGTLGRIEQ